VKERIEQLKTAAAPLEPNPEQRQRWTQQAAAYAQRYIESLSQRPVFQHSPDEGKGISSHKLSESPTEFELLLKSFAQHVEDPGLKLGAPGFMGFIHKGLFMPCGSGAVLVRDGNKLLAAYRYEAPYMQDRPSLASLDEISPSELSPELTRPFRGLRLWLTLKLLGLQPFRAALEEKLLLARYFYEELQGIKGFESGPPPDLSVVIFRYVPAKGDAEEFNRRLLRVVQYDGRIFLTSTRLDGKTWLRLAVLCATTHVEQIDLTLKILQEKAKELQSQA
jgi:hypothetical protein